MRYLFILSAILWFSFSQICSGQTNQPQEILDSANSLNREGINAIYSGKFQEGKELLHLSIHLKSELDSSFYTSTLPRDYNNLGLIHYYFNNLDSADYYLNLAEEMIKKDTSRKILLSIILMNKGRVLHAKGDLSVANNYYDQSLRTIDNLETTKAILRKHEIFYFMGMSQMILNQNKSNEYFEQAAMLGEKLPDFFSDGVYQKIADYHAKQGSLELYERYSNKERENLYENFDDTICSPLAYYYIDNAKQRALLGQHETAINFLATSEKILVKLNAQKKEFAELYLSYSHAYFLVRAGLEAETYINLALRNIYGSSNPKKFDSNNYSKIGIESIVLKSRILHLKFKETKELVYLDSCSILIDKAIDIIENSRNSFKSYESKVANAEMENKIYQLGLYYSWIKFDKTNSKESFNRAFEIAERSKSAALLSSIRQNEASVLGGIPEHLGKEERDLQREITFYKEQIYEEEQLHAPNQEMLDNWKDYLFNLNRKYDSLQEKLENEFPNYYQLKYANQVADIKKIRKQLPFNTSLVEFCIFDSLIYVFKISRFEKDLVVKPLDSSLVNSINVYKDEFSQFEFLSQTYQMVLDYEEASLELYEKLLGDVIDKRSSENLIIIADGILSYIPFEALVKSKVKQSKRTIYKDLDYLMKHHTVSYAYSSTLLLEMLDQREKSFSNNVLAVAPVYKVDTFPNGMPKYITRQQYRDQLYPIPGAKDEALFLEETMQASILIGDQATEREFKAQVSDYDILHLAMHTIIDNNNPMFSKLVFAPISDSLNDGLLNTSEIFGLNLKAKLAVLSACSTGDGEYKKGEGVISLARGFTYAGCPSMVFTMWRVHDKTGLKIMQEFYNELLNGKDKAKALQKAKLSYLENSPTEFQHPFYWSTYICMGNNYPIYHRNHWPWIIGVSSIIILVGVIIARRRKKTA